MDGTAMNGSTDTPTAVAGWHRLVDSPDRDRLRALIAPEAVFRSPAVHTPQEGADKTVAYLWAALQTFGDTLQYSEEWYREDSAVLHFTATVDGLSVEGVDIVGWNDDGLITSFTVMVRPYKALGALIQAMGEALKSEA